LFRGRVRYNASMKPNQEQGSTPAITFWGAARAVSGSMHLVEAEGRRILLDCGLNQGRSDDARQRNSQFPFHPRQIDAVILSHAHIDHSGNLPSLVRQGFRGPIYCTAPTRDLLTVMLADSARIQEEEAAHENIRQRYREPWREPLYTQTDVAAATGLAEAIPWRSKREILRGVQLTLLNAGHVLGSAMVHLTFASGGSVTFTGDLGRRGMPVLKSPDPVPPANVVICESTYGGEVHQPVTQATAQLIEIVQRTSARGGRVLIPAFSLGRTQLIVHQLCAAMRAGELEWMPIHVDSPLAADISDVYRRHAEGLRSEARQDLEFLGGKWVRYIREFEQSLRLSQNPEARIIVASSGMCEAGRILHHLKNAIDDPRCAVALVSYQAAGTTGRKMLDRGPTVRFLGKDWNKWAEITRLEGFSAHADQPDVLAYLQPLLGKAGKICLVHGENERAEALAAALRDQGWPDVCMPSVGDRVELASPLAA
jgi:metallo-beta-lactamase family protein